MPTDTRILATERLASLDGLKVIGSLGVLVIHVMVISMRAGDTAAPWIISGAFRWAVPAFFLTSAYVWHRKPRTLRGAVLSSSRLLLTYVLLSAFYLALRYALGERTLVGTGGIVDVLLFGGAAWPLWFLPSLAVCRVLVTWVKSDKVLIVLAAAGLPFFLMRGTVPVTEQPLYWFIHTSAAGWLTVYVLGSLLARTQAFDIPNRTVRVFVGLGIAVLGSIAYVRYAFPATAVAVLLMVFGITSVLVAAIVVVQSPKDPMHLSRIARWERYSFGFFALHMIAVYLIIYFGVKPWMATLPGTLVLVVVVSASSALLAWLLGKAGLDSKRWLG